MNSSSTPIDVTKVPPTDPPDLSDYYLGLKICLYTGIIVIPLGIVGNSLTIAVLSRTKLDSTRLYLIHLACADLLCILVGYAGRVFPVVLTGYDVASFHPLVCQAWLYVHGGVATASAWTLVAVTMERLLVVYMPLKAKVICTKVRAASTLVTIDVVFGGYFLHYFWSYGPVTSTDSKGRESIEASCTLRREDPGLLWFMMHFRPWFDFLIRSAGPFFCLLVSNCLIIGKVLLQVARRRSLSFQAGAGTSSARVRSMTMMLITISCVYLVCVTPLHAMYLVDKSDPFGRKIDSTQKARSSLRWACALAVYYVNHAVNFLLYCVSGTKFRRSLRATCRAPCPTRDGKGHGLQSTCSETSPDAPTAHTTWDK